MSDSERNHKNKGPLFSGDDDWRSNACVNFAWDEMHLFATGYRQAADLLADHVVGAKKHQDTLFWPIVLLYRHYFELQLKGILRRGYMFLDVEKKVPYIHNLANLWNRCIRVISQMTDKPTSVTKKDLKLVGDVINELSSVDPTGETFRYPRSRGGRKPLARYRVIGMKRLRDKLAEAGDLVDGVSLEISRYLGVKAEIGG